MILLGHLHTHEFAVGGTTDQVGNPWALERSAGGSSGGSAAALAARMVPAATGTDTAGSLRIPSALSGTSTIKPTRGLVSLRGVVPLAPSLDHAGPMARTLDDCALLLAGHGRRGAGALPGCAQAPGRFAGLRLAVSPAGSPWRSTPTWPTASSPRSQPAGRSAPSWSSRLRPRAARCRRGLPRPHLRRAARLPPALRRPRDAYRPALREWVEQAEERGAPAEQLRPIRRAPTEHDRRVRAVARATSGSVRSIEPTVPCVAPAARRRLRPCRERLRADLADALLGLDGLPRRRAPGGRRLAQRPARRRFADRPARLPTGELLDAGIQLQTELGVPDPYAGALTRGCHWPDRQAAGRRAPPRSRSGARGWSSRSWSSSVLRSGVTCSKPLRR